MSVSTCDEYASMLSRSAKLRSSPSNSFQKVGARLNGMGDLDRIANAMKAPMKRYISRQAGLVAVGLKMKQSR